MPDPAVDFKPAGHYPHGGVHPVEKKVGADFAFTLIMNGGGKFLANQLPPKKTLTLDKYREILDRAPVYSTLGKVASDAMQAYLAMLEKKASAKVAECEKLAADGSAYFTGMPHDIRILVHRRLRSSLKAARGVAEKDISFAYGGKELSQFVLEQLGNYDEIHGVVEQIEAKAGLSSRAVARVVSAPSTAGALAALQPKLKGAWSPEFTASLKKFLTALCLLVRSLEPARRRSAAPVNAIAQYFWRAGVVTSDQILLRGAVYAVMSHKGAASKSKAEHEGKRKRKKRFRNVLKLLLRRTDRGRTSIPLDRDARYDLKELALALVHWLNVYDSSVASRKTAREEFESAEVTTKPNKNGTLRASGVRLVHLKARQQAYYNAYRTGGGKGGSYHAVLRHYYHEEGPALTPDLKEASDNLRRLFIGLLAADAERIG